MSQGGNRVSIPEIDMSLNEVIGRKGKGNVRNSKKKVNIINTNTKVRRGGYMRHNNDKDLHIRPKVNKNNIQVTIINDNPLIMKRNILKRRVHPTRFITRTEKTKNNNITLSDRFLQIKPRKDRVVMRKA